LSYNIDWRLGGVYVIDGVEDVEIGVASLAGQGRRGDRLEMYQ